ncbi:hypothetical protein [Vulcanisaeta sp. JCM 14467]|uniref:hypothetical protein n=1 Tax=Vulcanisaeta sp. JCM 14467 TaxID=1295370 RepID=UPI0006D02F66|nr:hypothetical protein [Vulcanisaeta sp. JCM 14467]
MLSSWVINDMVRIVRINNYSDLDKVLIDLGPGECALLLARQFDDSLRHLDGVITVLLRSIKDKTEVDYLLAAGNKVLCISMDGFGLLSEYALSRLKYVIITRQPTETDTRLFKILLNVTQ